MKLRSAGGNCWRVAGKQTVNSLNSQGKDSIDRGPFASVLFPIDGQQRLVCPGDLDEPRRRYGLGVGGLIVIPVWMMLRDEPAVGADDHLPRRRRLLES